MCTHCCGLRKIKQPENQDVNTPSPRVNDVQSKENSSEGEIMPLLEIKVTRVNPFGERGLPFKCI